MNCLQTEKPNQPVRRTGLRPWVLVVLLCLATYGAQAQVPPNASERAAYTGLFSAAAGGDAARIRELLSGGANPGQRDRYARTPLHVATHAGQVEAMRALVAGGADPNALEADRYDIVTIASVANNLPVLRAALALGCSARNITSRYDGTALIAAAHLGHADVVRELIAAGAPLDHVNNLGWTALIESIILGDGGPRHTDTLRALLGAGASTRIADRNGSTPLQLARQRGYAQMVNALEAAGLR